MHTIKANLEYLLPFVKEWASEIKLIAEVPDYWANIERNEDEQRQIAVQLQQISKSLADKFELSAEQIEGITEKLDEAVEASTRMGRKDWLLLFGGTIFTVIVADIVAPDVAQHIFMTVIHGLTHLFAGSGEPPELPPHVLA
jgi:hypothetical protein